MKIVLVAGDFAQSEVLKALGDRIVQFGHTTESFLCYGKKDQFQLDSIRQSISGAGFLVVGMSELSGEETEAVKEAVRQNVRIALYADTFGAHRLPAFEFARELALTMFVVNQDEEHDARKLFPCADVFVTGNPRWEEFAFPKLSSCEAAHKLGLTAGKLVILSVGDKYLAQNIIQFASTIEAVRMLGWEWNTYTLLALHPGDPNDPKLYEELVRNSGCDVRIIGRHVGIDTSEILVGCDLVVEFTSTIGIQAACLRIPVVDFCTTTALRGKSPIIGKDPWLLTVMGASHPVYNGSVEQLGKFMSRSLLDYSYLSELRSKQERVFPVPSLDNRGRALKLMYSALTE